MLLTIFQGSNPIAASTTPTRIDSRASRKRHRQRRAAEKRCRPSLLAGKSLTSVGHGWSPPDSSARYYYGREHMGNPVAGVNGFGTLSKLYPRPISASSPAFQPVGLARRLVPAQAGLMRETASRRPIMPRRTRQSFERDLQHQALVGSWHDVRRAELFRGVAADEAVDLQQLFNR